MIEIDLDQGSPEWFAARLGIPTASNFGRIITPKTLKFSSQAQKYAAEILYEQRYGISFDGILTNDMANGIEMESEARDWFMFETDIEVRQVGIVYQDSEKNFSCSPDGLATGGLEIKCPTPVVQMGYLMDNAVPAVYIGQVQGSLWITGLEYWDFYSFHPDYKSLNIRVYRDEKFITALEESMDKFLDLIETMRVVVQ